ncbi:MAG: glycosyltransferase, partial [Caulobacteraceae bacterium]|nr:glycosyltransferase [Caulobacteraceae bacterium]
MALLVAALLALATWLYLVFANGFFWLARERDDRGEPDEPVIWPGVCAVVPARDEADVIARSIGGLLGQDYPGELRVILVDDGSSDGTADVARATAAQITGRAQLDVIAGQPLPPGWTGKLWAMAQGVERAGELDPKPEFLLLTDADIAHTPDNLRRLVARAEAGRLVLVSLMAKLRCDTFAETML